MTSPVRFLTVTFVAGILLIAVLVAIGVGLGLVQRGGAVAWAESSDEERARTRWIGLATFLVVAAIASFGGAIALVLIPLVFIPAAAMLTIIVVLRSFVLSKR